MIIGITGGTGCGKTTALQAVRKLGGVVIDCDEIYHRLLQTDKAMLQAIENRFPGTVINGTLNRKSLAPIVFSDEKALQDLNAITHGAIRAKVLEILSAKPKLAAIDAIELFDGGLAELCDITVAVVAPEADRVQRLTKRDSLTKEQAALRIHGQKPEHYFREKCDYILENTGTTKDFEKNALCFFENLPIIKENA